MAVIFGYCNNFNNEYNVITIERENTIEFYLEKIGHGNLLFMAGRDSSSSDFGCMNIIIEESINLAKNNAICKRIKNERNAPERAHGLHNGRVKKCY